MKRVILVLMLSLTPALVFADGNAPASGTKPKLTKREMVMKRTGGVLEDRRTLEGQFAFINLQQKVPASAFDNFVVGTMKQFFRTDFILVQSDAKFSMASAVSQREKAKAQAAVFIVDQSDLPTFVVVPEGNYAVVNVAALAADKPAEDVLARRVCREMWRGLAYVAGIDSMDDICVVHPVSNLKELDGLKANALSQEYLMRVKMFLPKIGIKPTKRCTYRQACEEGWAPPPTNQYQKVIWDSIKNK